VFPEEFETFLLGQPKLRQAFMRYHADLLTPQYWAAQQERINRGILDDVYPYAEHLRFKHDAV
jgi:isocitrate dehydrogenase kinase/phosphatase